MQFIGNNSKVLLEKFKKSPLLVFWESTKACPLACRHCRANSILNPLPDELTTTQAKNFIKQISEFSPQKPLLIITGGDPLCRHDLFELIEYANSLNVRCALSPAVSENLNEKTLQKIKEYGIKSISISLDGASKYTHEFIRQVRGVYKNTINAIKLAVDLDFQVQVNTLVWKNNLHELPHVVKTLLDLKVKIWEVFFLIVTGRAGAEIDITVNEYEDVIQFLVDVSQYNLQVRTVEAPFFRRAKLERLQGKKYSSKLYDKLKKELHELLGPPVNDITDKIIPTRDGSGIIFVAYNGDIYPSGFLPYVLGNVKTNYLPEIYENHPIIKRLKEADFDGECGICIYKDICGGSRARAYAYYKNLFAEDPACILTVKKAHDLIN